MGETKIEKRLRSRFRPVAAKKCVGQTTYGRNTGSDCPHHENFIGGVYFTGSFASATDFDPGAGTLTINTQGGDDCFFAKLDAAGNFVFADPIQSSASEFGHGVSCNANGAAAYAGYFNGAADFDPTPMTDFHAPSGFSDAFVVKYGNCSNTFSTLL